MMLIERAIGFDGVAAATASGCENNMDLVAISSSRKLVIMMNGGIMGMVDGGGGGYRMGVG